MALAKNYMSTHGALTTVDTSILPVVVFLDEERQ
jgi:hypothetical protein